MSKATTLFEPHLVINETKLAKSSEWAPSSNRWCLMQIQSGVSYCRQPDEIRELPAGSTMVIGADARASLLASQLNDVMIAYVWLDPDKLTGLLNLKELRLLQGAGSRKVLLVLPPDDPVSARFKTLCREANEGCLPARLQLLELFFELIPGQTGDEPASLVEEMDGRGRLKRSLTRMAASDFVALSLSELAPRMGCSTRHLSRLFRREMGTSFREKQTEVRLAKACQLLAASNAKLVEVALNSGYRSYSLFAQLFKKRFGMSPAKWRLQQASRVTPRQRKLTRIPAL